MGERKVLNKYFPPDFDPSKLPKGKRVRTEEKQMKVRMMLPMSVRCNTCGNFMYKGTKFNTRMEDVKGENYLGIKIFRFYYRCTNCSAEFCMKTDPKSADYIVEDGATRNYEPWRDTEAAVTSVKAQREEEEKGNAMKALENKTLDSKREMDILAALDEMKSLKARHEAIDTETALHALKRAAAKEEAEQSTVDLDAEDEEAVRQMLLQRAGFVRRLPDANDEDVEEEDKSDVKSSYSSKRLKLGPSAAMAALEEEEDQAQEEEENRRVFDLPEERNERSHVEDRGALPSSSNLNSNSKSKPKSKFQIGAPSFKASSRIIKVQKQNKKNPAGLDSPGANVTNTQEDGSALLGLAGYGSSGGSSEG